MICELPIRKGTRLPDYDYSSPGAFFVTVCTHQRIDYFKNPDCARICREVWEETSTHFNVKLDQFVIMPDHVHFIIWICGKKELGGDFEKGGDCATGGNLETGDACVAPTIDKSKSMSRRVEACLDRPHGAPSCVAPTNDKSKSTDRRVEACLDHPHGAPPNSLPTIVGSFKSAVARRIRDELEIGFVWQRSFYDHVIRNETDLAILRGYILNNPEELAVSDYFAGERPNIPDVSGTLKKAKRETREKEKQKDLGI